MRRFLYWTPPSLGLSTGLLAVRLVAGTAFMIHGWGKIQNPFAWMGEDATIPAAFQALAALAEFGGGLAWIVGLLTPLASLGIICTMAVAASTHMSKGDPFVGKGGPSYELALVYLTIGVLLFLGGPGRFSLDSVLFGHKPKPASLASK